jgi:hypothetical protein
MFDGLVLVLLVLALMALDVLALEFGADSRTYPASLWPGF